MVVSCDKGLCPRLCGSLPGSESAKVLRKDVHVRICPSAVVPISPSSMAVPPSLPSSSSSSLTP